MALDSELLRHPVLDSWFLEPPGLDSALLSPPELDSELLAPLGSWVFLDWKGYIAKEA